MARKEDWPERLHEAILARSHQTFAWGETDCLQTAATLIQAMTGNDVAAPYRGQYRDEAGAQRTVGRAGCASFEALVEQIAREEQWPEISPRLAQRGDLVAFDTAEGVAFGLVSLNGREAVCAGQAGLRFLPVLSARRAWRIS